jgi:hypothetical protein
VDVNPYQPPSDLAATLSSEQADAGAPRRRPIGIWILAGVHLLAGLLFLSALLLFLYQIRSADNPGRVYSFFWFATVVSGFMAGVGLSSAIGLWRGARWGWWLATFYYVWAVLGVLADFLMALPWVSHMDVESITVSLLVRVIQLVIHALILAYLFKRNVRAFCKLQSLRIDQALIPLVIIAVMLLAASYLVTRSQFAGAF